MKRSVVHKKKKTGRRQNRDERPSHALRVTGIRSFAPPRVLVQLKFFKTGNISGPGTSAGERLFPTNAYDVDPLFASTAMPGFSEWGLLYRSYRTLSSKISVEFSNMSAYPMAIVLGPANYDYITSWSASNFTSLSSQPTSKKKRSIECCWRPGPRDLALFRTNKSICGSNVQCMGRICRKDGWFFFPSPIMGFLLWRPDTRYNG